MRTRVISIRPWIGRFRSALGSLPIGYVLCWVLPLGLFWIPLGLRIPYSLSLQLSAYSSVFFLSVLGAYYLAFRPKTAVGTLAGLTLTMLLVALSVSALWTSGKTENGIIGGLLPYKDAKNYYFGALQLLNGLPLERGVNAVRRPLLPGLLASLLLITGSNLKLTTAILAQFTGFGLFVSARAIRNSFGPAAAAVYASLLLFHIQPKLGYTVSELLGFTLGCLALAILWSAAPRRSSALISLGLLTLMAAISARAGAFLIFPFLAFWCGWIFRQGPRYSARAVVISATALALLYLLINPAFSRLLNIDLADQWSNFAYAMYGQVHGGAGWHSAIEDLDTHRSSVVAAAAWSDFRAHPLSLLIGVVKSYRDFFVPSDLMIFPFGSPHEPAWAAYAFWAAAVLLLLRGLIESLRGYRLARPSLLLACFAGTLLSVPFLPPIDGGARFYASTVAFLFALPAAALAGRAAWTQTNPEEERRDRSGLALAAGSALLILTLSIVAPIAIYRLTPPQTAAPPVCPAGQLSFVIRTQPDGYVDVLPDATTACGLVPRICMSDFEQNSNQVVFDDFAQALLVLAHASPGGIRITPGLNLVDARFSYFVGYPGAVPAAPAGQLISGCATLIETKNSLLFQIESQGPSGGG